MQRSTLRSRIPQIVAELDPETKEALQKGAELIVTDAKERVPVDSGDLREAIHTEEAPDGVYVVAGDTRAFYGHIVENGSVRTPPRPFLVPAKEARQQDVLDLVGEALGDL